MHTQTTLARLAKQVFVYAQQFVTHLQQIYRVHSRLMYAVKEYCSLPIKCFAGSRSLMRILNSSMAVPEVVLLQKNTVWRPAKAVYQAADYVAGIYNLLVSHIQLFARLYKPCTALPITFYNIQ